jgi:hypothetical protein
MFSPKDAARMTLEYLIRDTWSRLEDTDGGGIDGSSIGDAEVNAESGPAEMTSEGREGRLIHGEMWLPTSVDTLEAMLNVTP